MDWDWGFSVVGLAAALAVLAPNALLLLFPPVGGIPRAGDAGPFFTVLERAGQAGCLALLAACGTRLDHGVDAWFWLMVTAIAAYYALWLRYLLGGRQFAALYRPWGVIPIPMAVFPVLAFAFAALWARSAWIGAAVVLLAVGHLANSWHVYRATTAGPRPR